MKMKNFKKSLSLILCIVLIAATALFATGCKDNTTSTDPAVTTTAPVASSAASAEVNVLGEGKTVFDFTVTDFDGKETAFEIHTDKKTVGEALLELGLIAGDNSEFGLYVKTVNDITADFDKDGKYWAFYIDGAYAATGVDSTDIEEGKTYSFKVE